MQRFFFALRLTLIRLGYHVRLSWGLLKRHKKKAVFFVGSAVIILGAYTPWQFHWRVPGPFTLDLPTQTCVNGNPVISLNWTAADNASSYQVQRRTSAQRSWSNDMRIANNLTTTNFFDRSAIIPNTYIYRVTAVNRLGKTNANNRTIVVTSCLSSPINPTPTPIPSPTPSPVPTPSPTPTPVPAPTPVPTPASAATKVRWGAYPGYRNSDITNFDANIGASAQLIAQFVAWGNEKDFPMQYTSVVRDAGKTLVIYWEPQDYEVSSTTQSSFSYAAIVNGDWDSYIAQFAADAKTYGGPVIMVPFPEMNGNWDPWSGTNNGNTPALEIAAYRHVRDFFRDAHNVKFGWAPNYGSVPDTDANQLERYYPGDAYVDYVGVDGFNFGDDPSWQTFDQIFGDALARLKVYNKPIYIFSFASTAGAKKAAWITDALAVQIPRHPEIAGWIWFNEKKEKNWLIWSDAASLAAFQQGVGK